VCSPLESERHCLTTAMTALSVGIALDEKNTQRQPDICDLTTFLPYLKGPKPKLS
jgi:hypothetical protein